jgi:hypothetical protein
MFDVECSMFPGFNHPMKACLKNAGDDVRRLILFFKNACFPGDLSLVTSAPTFHGRARPRDLFFPVGIEVTRFGWVKGKPRDLGSYRKKLNFQTRSECPATFAGRWCLILSNYTVYLEIMKRLGKIVVCLASGLVLNAGARADDGVLPNNPYAPIVVRNVFDLNPPPPADAGQPADPPPKITPNGIMSIFGQLQVLFKVAGTAKPGQPAKDESYILSEGQRQDEIEVIQIDEKNSLVTFNNHGIVQELPLVKANPPAVSTPMAAQGGPVPTRNLTAPNGENSGRIPGRFGGGPASGPGAARNRGMGGGSPLTTVPTSAGYSGQQQPQNTMTPEAQVILMEAQRAQLQKEGNPAAALIPPTVLTPQNGAGGLPPIP